MRIFRDAYFSHFLSFFLLSYTSALFHCVFPIATPIEIALFDIGIFHNLKISCSRLYLYYVGMHSTLASHYQINLNVFSKISKAYNFHTFICKTKLSRLYIYVFSDNSSLIK